MASQTPIRHVYVYIQGMYMYTIPKYVYKADMPTFGVSKEGDEILVGSGGVLPPGNFWSSVMAFPAF
jgi:hypothetical protein